MTIKMDPEKNEIRALRSLASLKGASVLEIGCGDGRLTWRYAEEPAKVTAIDPFELSIRRARENLPAGLQGRIEFQQAAFEEFASKSGNAVYDVAILAWSLC
jgi:2-polyprenyl-3-methyl-5-hydroxy-6-metoxy-1,4-benzoquinol methylase